MKKSIISIISIVSVLISSFSASAAEVPRESAPCNASNESIIFVESCIGDILTEVQNGLGYSDARAKSKRIFFDAFLKGQTNGYRINNNYRLCRKLLFISRLPVCDYRITRTGLERLHDLFEKHYEV